MPKDLYNQRFQQINKENTFKKRIDLDTASFYNDYDDIDFNVNYMDDGDSQIIEEHFNFDPPADSWVNFLNQFIDFQIIQDKKTGEIYAINSK